VRAERCAAAYGLIWELAMKCEDCQKVLEEYFDGELGERAAREVGEHLAKCETCARAFEALKDEQNLYALYRREVEVTPMLWSGVAARIREETQLERAHPISRWLTALKELFGTPRLSPALTFALLILAVGATAGLMKYMQSRNVSQQPVAKTVPESAAPAQPKPSNDAAVNVDKREPEVARGDNGEPAAPDEKREERVAPAYKLADKVESKRVAARTVGYTDGASPDVLVRDAEQKYRAAIALLARDAKRRRTLLEPDVRARFDQTLAAVDRTISETRAAVRQQPDDPVAVQYMLSAYAKKVEVLREMASYRAYERDVQ
jgi:anti-sigma factor RsiW